MPLINNHASNEHNGSTSSKDEGYRKTYWFYGIGLTGDGKQLIGDCPFCGREKKFAVEAPTGLWRCLVCSSGSDRGGGNLYTFLRLLWDMSDKKTTEEYKALCTQRKLLYPESLMYWGAAKSAINGEWLVPGYSIDGKINALYVYTKKLGTDKAILTLAPGTHHQLLGLPLFKKNARDIYLVEGYWNAIALWETMRSAKKDTIQKHVLVSTSSESASLLASASIIGVPGCNVFAEVWAPLFANKRVHLVFDSDHPKKVVNRVSTAGFDGMKRVAGILGKSEQPPTEIHFVKWGEEGYDPDQPSGYDVREVLSKGNTLATRLPLLGGLLDKIEPIPADWIAGRSVTTARTGGVEIECVDCRSWDVLVKAWQSAMMWTEGLDRALSVMLASICSVKAIGDQLWVKIISPASSGKSTLCEAISVNKKHVVAKSTIRGFHSGFKSDRSGAKDNSLIADLYDKTLITKDGDTLLQSPNLAQILSEARDIYDSTSRTHYRHGLKRDYEGVRMTWILCGTSALRQIDTSELGERFLDCVIMEAIDIDLENQILLRVANRTDRGMGLEADGTLESQQDPDQAKAMQLTGGYINYLRANARDLLVEIKSTPKALDRCIQLAKFVAYMRARPSTRQIETAERELAARLVSQLVRLAKCLAVVLNKKDIDNEVMRRVRMVALDTARGATLETIKHIYNAGERGISAMALAVYNNQTPEKENAMLRFLRNIKVIALQSSKVPGMASVKPMWKLTPEITQLYESVMEDKESLYD